AWIQQYPDSYRLPMDDYAETASRYNEFFRFTSLIPSFLTDEGSHSFNYWNSGDFFDNGPVPPDYYDFLAQLLRAAGGDSSPLALQNVLGNVWEWQTDTFDPQDLSARSIRGASWYSNQELIDPAKRFAADPGSGFADVGFRVVSSRGAAFEVEIAENAEFTDSTVLTMPPEFPDLNGYYSNRTRELSLAPSTDYFWRVRGFYSGDSESEVPIDLPFGAPWDSPMPYATFRTSHQVQEPTLQLNLAGEWNLVSVNVEPDIAHPKHLFGADSTAWGWDSEQQIYFRLYEIKPFEGFWIHVPEPGILDVAGFTPEPEIEIRDGWNLLGPLNDGAPIPSTSKLRGEVLQYLNGGYESADVLDTGIGYWMFFVSNFVHDFSGDGEDDYDTVGFTVTESAGSTVVAESGGTDTFDVVLNAQPGSDVILTVTSNSTADATVNLASLVFTPAGWDVAQTVTVTGVDDYEEGEDVTTVTLAVAAGSSEAWADQDVVVTCTDD
ncbi:MAG TPA: hypothetical protein DIT01_20040, partial [Lentisphaeria bacterium]|nr:hypothetical protein [Lentisphaeria bacterium]